MQLLDQLEEGRGRDAIRNLAETYGVPEHQAASLVDSILPELARAIERNTLSRGGIANVVDLLGRQDYQRFLSPDANLGEADNAGVDALQEVFRSKSRSRAIAARASNQTGLPEETIKAMLPQIAAIAMGAISQQLQGGLENLREKIPQARRSWLGFGPSVGQQQPLPMPNDDMLQGPADGGYGRQNPYGDITDIIRRKGRIDGQRPGNVIRDILGQMLGFQNKGIVGWIIQFIIARYGWRIIRAVLGRLLTGR
ncbi:MAG: hypothetical protein RLZ98_2405 [Pseudomonadota bacterium]|jgi:hypothetical protein